MERRKPAQWARCGVGRFGTTLGGVINYVTADYGHQDIGQITNPVPLVSKTGDMIPVIYGTMRLGGNLIWATDLTDVVVSDGGGKGKPTTNYHRYHCSMAVMVCRGNIAQINKIWADDVLIFDINATPVAKSIIRVYCGNGQIYPTLDNSVPFQNPDSAIVGALGTSALAYRGNAYVVFEDFDCYDYGNRVPAFQFEVEESSMPTLEHILTGECVRAGVDPAFLNFSAGVQQVVGYAVTSRGNVRDSLDNLLKMFSYDLVEYDGMLNLLARGGAAVATIDVTELGATTGEMKSSLEVRRTAEIEIPSQVDISYSDPANNYQVGTQTTRRFSKPNMRDALSIQAPVALGGAVAAQVSSRVLYTAWRERELFRSSVPMKYCWLTPADVINVPIASTTRRLRIEQMDLAPLGESMLSMVSDDTDVFTQVGTGGSYAPPTGQSQLSVVPTVFRAFANVVLSDEHLTSPGFYVVANGASGWGGGSIYYSPDGGTAWVLAGFIRNADAIGSATTALTDWVGVSGLDSTHTVNLTLTNGSLSPCSTVESSNGINTDMLGNEVLSFAGATLTGGSSYQLSSILRRLRSTLGTGHTNTDKFCTVKNAVRVPVASSLIGATVPVRDLLWNKSSILYSFVGNGQKPLV